MEMYYIGGRGHGVEVIGYIYIVTANTILGIMVRSYMGVGVLNYIKVGGGDLYLVV